MRNPSRVDPDGVAATGDHVNVENRCAVHKVSAVC
jgi:hypothetical protein